MGYHHSWDILTTYYCSNSGHLNVLNQYSTYSEKCPYNSECLTFTPIPPFSDLFHHTLPSFPFVSGPWKLNHFHVILPPCLVRLGPLVFLGHCFFSFFLELIILLLVVQ